ncbi:MAG: hypothetical protein V3T23_10220 [Nitrososphaerales archaeon]
MGDLELQFGLFTGPMEKRAKLKRIIAKEWLIFALFFFLSPAIFAVYLWVSSPRVLTRTFPRVESSKAGAISYEAPAPPRLYNELHDTYRVTSDQGTIEVTLDFSKLPPKGGSGLTLMDLLIDNTWLSADMRKLFQMELGFPIGDQAEVLEVVGKKRGLLNYLTDSIKILESYIAIISIYPLYWFIRLLVWSIRTIRRRES